MKLLSSITAVLSVLWIVSAAPQPLSLNNSTSSELSDLSTVHEIDTLEIANSTSSASPGDKEISDKETLPGSLESSTESFNVREEYEERKDDKIKDKTEFPVETVKIQKDTDKSISLVNDSIDAFINAENANLKPTENSEMLNEREIPITRYVPPLDPMKHMLIMADLKAMTHKTESDSSTHNPTLKELEEKNVDFVRNTTYNAGMIAHDLSTENSNVVVTETTVAALKLNNSNNESDETTTDSSLKTTFNVDLWKKLNEAFFSFTGEKEISKESLQKFFDSKPSENIFTDPSEINKNDEKAAEETTIIDFTTQSSTALLTSDEVTSVKFFNNETLDDNNSTLKPFTDTEEKTLNLLERTTEPEKTEESILKNADIEISTRATTDEVDKNINETEATSLFSSTEEAFEIKNFTISDNLLKNNDKLETDLPISTSERTPFSTMPSKSVTEIDITSTSTAKETEDVTSILTTQVPESTATEIRDTPESGLESERKNISLDDELEFRAVKIPQNTSKVSYVEKDNVNSHDLDVFEDSSEIITESETSTPSIFTTIVNILFDSTSTEVPSNSISEITETETSHETNPTEKLPLETDSHITTVFINNSSDALEIQPVTPELDSVPADDVTVATTSTESFSIHLAPEEILKSNFEKDFNGGNVEKIPETTTKTDTTTSVSLKTETTTEFLFPSTTSSAISEAESIDLELKAVETSKNGTEDSGEKLYDYLSNSNDRYVSGNNTDMVAAVQFLHYHDKASSEQCFKLVNAHWNYATNLTEENKKKQLEQTLEYSQYHKSAWKNATSFAWKTFNDTLLRRWFKSLSVLGNAALPEDKFNEFNKLKAEMKNTYSTAKICAYISPEDAKKGQILQEKDCNLSLEPDLQRILTKSRDYNELVHVWKSWRDAAGKPIREKYLRFVDLGNEAARINGFSDIGDMWREAYESETFESDLAELWEQLRPLYENLHAYVRRRLIQQYGADKIKEDGPIPAHLFGNMWAQSWVSLLDITQPFPGKPSVDVTPIMQAKNMTAYEMFKTSEEFFTSLGLKEMPETFWKHSLIEKPKDREIICHASAWDFCNGKDYRIKQCTDITMEDLITVHHEMGHVQYFLQYARQPAVFREGANPGFHEAIGDVIALSVSTPKHLQSIGLLDDVADDPEGDLNFLLYTALDKVSFLPSAYMIELWRWGLFSSEIKPEEMNSKWWELRLKYQGICPPVKRTDTDFDPGAKYHMPGHVPYIRYFVSFVIQFQFHKVLCDAAGHTGPLYKCDIYRSTEAGQILSQVMELGSSEHWSEAMKIMTGGATNKMDAGPIMEYFEPLLEFLKEQNRNETLGWRSDDPTICP